MNDLSIQIEALLFAFGRPLSRKELAEKLGASAEEITSALAEFLQEKNRGVVVVDDGKEVELRVSPNAAETIERVRKDEYSRDIGKAGLETLAVVLYRGPITRSEVDFIRGVNSSYILRALSIRGLVRKVPDAKDERQFLYEPTTELLAELGVSSAKNLPSFTEVKEKLQTLEMSYKNKE